MGIDGADKAEGMPMTDARTTPPAIDPTGKSESRRYDLDALRAFAMLLGLLLHGALSYMDIPWVVRDSRPLPELGLFVSAIHGFRMPLFFMLSGYFTAMLWQRRGLSGLIRHRVRRIALPLGIGCATIVPVMWVVVILVAPGNRPTPPDPKRDIWTAAAMGDDDSVRAFVGRGAPLDLEDPMFHTTPLGWAVICDHPDIVARLLDAGADPNARYGAGHTAMHSAAFFGRAGAAKLLIDAGADVDAQNDAGESPTDSARFDEGTTQAVAGSLGFGVDFGAVSDGRDQIRTMIETRHASAGGVPHVDGPVRAGRGGPLALAKPLLVDFPFFHHLWFLWHLCWLVAGFALVVLVLSVLPRITIPQVLIASPLALLWVVPLAMLSQSFMHAAGAIAGFGPDTSAGLIPAPHVLAHYAVYFGFGALLFTVPAGADRVGRTWWLTLPAALVLLPFVFSLSMLTDWDFGLVGDESTRRLLANGGQVLYAWLMIFGLMGLFGAVLARARPWVRYMSDSSYWLYLVHLPLIIGGQALLRNVDQPALLKLGVLMLVSTALLLASYHWMVRYSPIGRLLNGPRVKAGRTNTAHAAASLSPGA